MSIESQQLMARMGTAALTLCTVAFDWPATGADFLARPDLVG
ncbi:MAG TPA: hypothetical protein VH640_22570 [Bryobacteraceae bacterium]|jgi:hypothetical protein